MAVEEKWFGSEVLGTRAKEEVRTTSLSF